MAVTVVNNDPAQSGFCLTATSADLSGCETLKAAPASGTAIILEHLTINSTAQITVTVGEGETAGAVDTALIGPVDMVAHGTVSFDFYRGGIKLSDATALTADASGSGAVCIIAQGRIE
jgi:hypothetical protein